MDMDNSETALAYQVKPFTVPVYAISNEGKTRQILAVKSARLQKDLRAEAIKYGAVRYGSWYALVNGAGVRSLVQLTKNMGGYVYDMPRNRDL